MEQCNAHWMEVLRRQSESSAYAAAEAEKAASERLDAERAKVRAHEEAALRAAE